MRAVPLMGHTVQLLRDLIQENHLDGPEQFDKPLFQNARKQRLSRSGVRYILHKYHIKARDKRPSLNLRCGHEVISVADNEAAKQALTSIHGVDMFVVGHTAPEQTRKEIVDWLKANFAEVKVVALIPSANRQLPRADYNVVLNDWDEWISLLGVAMS